MTRRGDRSSVKKMRFRCRPDSLTHLSFRRQHSVTTIPDGGTPTTAGMPEPVPEKNVAPFPGMPAGRTEADAEGTPDRLSASMKSVCASSDSGSFRSAVNARSCRDATAVPKSEVQAAAGPGMLPAWRLSPSAGGNGMHQPPGEAGGRCDEILSGKGSGTDCCPVNRQKIHPAQLTF